MNTTYVITVISSEKDKNGNLKSKTSICHTDVEMFKTVQDAMSAELKYEVYKAELSLVLTNAPDPNKEK